MPDTGRLSDADQIRNLLYDYAEAIDSRNLDALRELFADAIVSLTEGREWRGARAGGDPGQPVPWKPASAALHPRATKHLITNVGIEIDETGEVASTRSYFTVLHATDALPLQVVIAGRYHDTFRREDARWRFASRVYIIDLVGNAGELLDVDAGTLETLRAALRRVTPA